MLIQLICVAVAIGLVSWGIIFLSILKNNKRRISFISDRIPWIFTVADYCAKKFENRYILWFSYVLIFGGLAVALYVWKIILGIVVVSGIGSFIIWLFSKSDSSVSDSKFYIQHAITVKKIGNGTVTPCGDGVVNVLDGGSIEFVLRPGEGDYEVTRITVDGKEVEVKPEYVQSYSFNNIKTSHEIIVYFGIIDYFT